MSPEGFAGMVPEDTYPYGARVWKISGGYVGPCRICGYAIVKAGLRYVVAYEIYGGCGDILHIQSPKELTEYEAEFNRVLDLKKRYGESYGG